MVKTEIYCHECDGYVTIDLDASKDGCHCVDCPKCGHPHFRVVEKGKITSARYNPFITQVQYTGMWSASASTATSGYTSSASTTSTDSYCGGWTEYRSI